MIWKIEDFPGRRFPKVIGEINRHNVGASHTGGIVIACGCAKYEDDACVATVFDRADHKMYENKNALKSAPDK